jgi:hypothetical protein
MRLQLPFYERKQPQEGAMGFVYVERLQPISY